MSDIVIAVENLSKSYQLGQIGTGTLSRDLEVWWARLRGQPNPLLKIGEKDHGNRQEETLWALRDVSFTVKQGEVLGIIGRNGAGKSTLLKILSRVTAPTSGRVKVKGRIASLLEVGTGFHPELSGRENIFLNGAILGMSKDEVRRKFDEIVDFSGVEKFIDTPVKRYSSGMYVRLAFAVAAHLDPEILVVDEVLAVGDAEFQKKCLGKMGDVAKDGRTVLFVSHNLAVMSAICTRAFLLQGGNLQIEGQTENVIRQYLLLSEKQTHVALWERVDRKGSGQLKFTDIGLLDANLTPVTIARAGEELVFALNFERIDDSPINQLTFEIGVYNQFEQLIFLCGNNFAGGYFDTLPRLGTLLCHVPNLPLQPGYYNLNIYCGCVGKIIDWVINVAGFEVVEGDFFGTGRLPPGQGGIILARHHWELENDPNKKAPILRGKLNEI